MTLQSTPISKVRKCHICIDHPVLMPMTLYCGYIKHLKRSKQAVNNCQDCIWWAGINWPPSIKSKGTMALPLWFSKQQTNKRTRKSQRDHTTPVLLLLGSILRFYCWNFPTCLLCCCYVTKSEQWGQQTSCSNIQTQNQWQSRHNGSSSSVEKFASLH